MYRTYKLKGDEKYVISMDCGDCMAWTACDNKQEYDEEKARLDRIDEEYRKAKEALIGSGLY